MAGACAPPDGRAASRGIVSERMHQAPPRGQPHGPPPAGQAGPYGAPSAYTTPPPYPTPPPYGYGPGSAPPVSPTKELDDQSLIWLCVAGAGFFFGLLFVTGPLAWFFGAKLRTRYRLMGFEPNGAATAAMIVGIVETALVLLVAIPVFILVFVVGLAAVAG